MKTQTTSRFLIVAFFFGVAISLHSQPQPASGVSISNLDSPTDYTGTITPAAPQAHRQAHRQAHVAATKPVPYVPETLSFSNANLGAISTDLATLLGLPNSVPNWFLYVVIFFLVIVLWNVLRNFRQRLATSI
jgi:hypothetical protein